MADIKKVQPQYPIPVQDKEYVKLVSQISDFWNDARNKAFQAVNYGFKHPIGTTYTPSSRR